jgi:hypothetical protein
MQGFKRFGTGVDIDITTPADPLLVIHLKSLMDAADGGDITTGNGFDSALSVTDGNLNTYADRIAAALFVLWLQEQGVEDNDESQGIRIDANPYKNITTVNDTSLIEFIYTIRFRILDLSPTLVPNDVV